MSPIVGFGVETVGTDAGAAHSFDPPFPVHHFLLGAGKYGLTQLANLAELPPTGAIVVVAPLKLVDGTGTPSRVLALTAWRRRRAPLLEGVRDRHGPSSGWWFSISAISVRPTATAVPFSVCTCVGLAAVRPVADVQPAGLEVGRVRGRGELAVALLGRQPGLEVVLLGRRVAEVVDRDVDHAVGDLERLEDLLLDRQQPLVLGRRRPPAATNENISTLSNWCTRKMPRVSLPAAPASRRKQGEKPA